MKKPQVFISFAHSSQKEREWVRIFVKTLTSHGASVWWDESRPKAGEHWEDALENALRRSDIIAFILTPDSLDQSSIYFELGAALAARKRIVPILAEEMSSTDIPFPLRSRQGLVKESPRKTALEFLEATKAEGATIQKED